MLGDWRRGEKYIRNIIEDLNHWVVGNPCFMPIFYNNLYLFMISFLSFRRAVARSGVVTVG